jgi:hypothetical protein
MKINIDMEAWELATVIKGLTINAQPEEKKPKGVKPILSDKTREELKKAIANAFKVPERLMSDDNSNPDYRPPMGGSHQ